MKLADKLYNLRDLDKQIPTGWSENRVKEYFIWAERVVKGLRGTNIYIEEELDKLFFKHGVLKKI